MTVFVRRDSVDRIEVHAEGMMRGLAVVRVHGPDAVLIGKVPDLRALVVEIDKRLAVLEVEEKVGRDV